MRTQCLHNRPMLAYDLDDLGKNPWALAIRALVHRYQDEALPVMNGSFAYSNLREGPAHSLTCLPYRLWEYASLFVVLGQTFSGNLFLDVGGASSPLVYFLAEKGYQGITIDLQPLLVDVCNYVAAVRKLGLQSVVGNIGENVTHWSDRFDFVTFVSVLEHIDPMERPAALSNIHRVLRRGGLLYMTFDYGHYVDSHTAYARHKGEQPTLSASINDLGALCELLEAIGFRFVGNDPRSLPSGILAHTSSPEHQEIMLLRSLNIGPVDGETPWLDLLKYAVKRVVRRPRVRQSRFAEHNFFRMFLEKV